MKKKGNFNFLKGIQVHYSKNIKSVKISTSKINDIQAEILAPLKREAGYSPAWVTQTLQSIMIPNFDFVSLCYLA